MVHVVNEQCFGTLRLKVTAIYYARLIVMTLVYIASWIADKNTLALLLNQ